MMEEKYAPHAIEKKWQQYWEEHDTFKREIDTATLLACRRKMRPSSMGSLPRNGRWKILKT